MTAFVIFVVILGVYLAGIPTFFLLMYGKAYRSFVLTRTQTYKTKYPNKQPWEVAKLERAQRAKDWEEWSRWDSNLSKEDLVLASLFWPLVLIWRILVMVFRVFEAIFWFGVRTVCRGVDWSLGPGPQPPPPPPPPPLLEENSTQPYRGLAKVVEGRKSWRP